MRALVVRFALSVALVSSGISAQPLDVVGTSALPNLVRTEARTPRGDANALPLSSFSVSRGIGIVEDDGNSYWPGFPSSMTAPATFRVTQNPNNTFTVRRIDYQFDDPAGATVVYNGATRPIVGFVDATYNRYTLPNAFTFGGQSYTTVSISKWGALAFGNANSADVNYDPTVVSSMFRIPMVAVWYELFYYPTTARIYAKNKAGSVVITWQNLRSRHSATPCTFQIELFDNGEMQLSYQSLPVDHGIVGFSTGSETPSTRHSVSVIDVGDAPAHMQLSQGSLDDYSGIITGLTLKLRGALPSTMASSESYRYTLVINGVDAAAIQVGSNLTPYIVVANPKIPDFPAAQINSWETKLSGDTLSMRFPATSLEPYLAASGTNTWAIRTTRFGGAGFLDRNVTGTLPLTLGVRHSLLPASVGQSVEAPAIVFHHLPGVWNSDRIRESISAWLTSRGLNVDTFRFFPTIYDDGLRHHVHAGTYPRTKSVSGIGEIPARTDCACIYGGEFSSVTESLADEGTTMVALTHELVHEYVLYADYRDLDGAVKGVWRDAGIPCTGGAHPNDGVVNTPMFADTESATNAISVMGGSVTGTFRLNTPRFGMSRMEMYLMGLATPGEVLPVTFVQGNTTTTITVDQVIAAHGARNPAWVPGQSRVFRVPTFVVRRKGESVSDAQLAELQKMLFRWQTRFWREAGGRARASLALDTSCSTTLAATTARASASSTTASVSVLADCPWTATSDASWITIASGGSGTGDGVVRYTTATNTSGAARTGTITIGGQPFTITQGAGDKRRAAKR